MQLLMHKASHEIGKIQIHLCNAHELAQGKHKVSTRSVSEPESSAVLNIVHFPSDQHAWTSKRGSGPPGYTLHPGLEWAWPWVFWSPKCSSSFGHVAHKSIMDMLSTYQQCPVGRTTKHRSTLNQQRLRKYNANKGDAEYNYNKISSRRHLWQMHGANRINVKRSPKLDESGPRALEHHQNSKEMLYIQVRLLVF
jgi:hypothetical protein